MLVKNIILLTMLGLSVPFCTDRPSAAPSEERTAFLDGRIDAQDALGLERILASHEIEKVVLNSRGGEENASLKIAELIRQNDIDVEVRGICLSACVNLLVAGSKRSVAKGSLILTHHTSYAMEDWARLSDFENTGTKEFAFAFSAKVAPIAEYYEEAFWPSISTVSVAILPTHAACMREN